MEGNYEHPTEAMVLRHALLDLVHACNKESLPIIFPYKLVVAVAQAKRLLGIPEDEEV